MNYINKLNVKDLRAYSEINLLNLKHNLSQIEKMLQDKCKVMAVVKADAYGHGSITVSKYLQDLGVEHFGVASIDEAIELRQNNIQGEILVLGYTPISRRKDLINYNITQTVVDEIYASELCNGREKVKVHIKLDTGMNRAGEKIEKLDKLIDIYTKQNLEITGTFSHLSRADSLLEEDMKFTEKQIDNFNKTIEILKSKGIDVGKTHLQSSYGIINYNNVNCDLARPGIILYGVSSDPDDGIIEKLSLRPVLSIKTRVGLVKNVNKLETVGYGNNFKAEQDCKIAVVTIGYADGYPRSLSKKNCKVLINGKKVPVIGNVCMDQMMVDATSIEGISPGDIVTLVGGDDKSYLSIDQISRLTNTINNETLAGIGKRVTKVYID